MEDTAAALRTAFHPSAIPNSQSNPTQPNCHSINLARELFFDCSFVDSKECADSKALARASSGGFQIIYAAGHMHVGGLSLELFNLDTGAWACLLGLGCLGFTLDGSMGRCVGRFIQDRAHQTTRSIEHTHAHTHKHKLHAGELLCRQVPEYVDGYVEVIPPCVWSEAEGDGLPRPPVLTPETRLVRPACGVVQGSIDEW